jgi:hypothetical protein
MYKSSKDTKAMVRKKAFNAWKRTVELYIKFKQDRKLRFLFKAVSSLINLLSLIVKLKNLF